MFKSVLYYTQRFNCNLPSAIVFKKSRKFYIEKIMQFMCKYTRSSKRWCLYLFGVDLHLTYYGETIMDKPESKQYVPIDLQLEIVQSTTPPSTADLMLMAKLFSLGDMGTWVRDVNAPTSEPAKRVLRAWVRKGYAHYVQDQDTKVYLLRLNDDCARMCGEAIAAAFDVRVERSMLDQKQKLSPLMWVEAAVLTLIIISLLVASVLL